MNEPEPIVERACGRPIFEDTRRLWPELQVVEENPSLPNLMRYAEALDRIYVNGGVRILAYRLGPNRVFDWYAQRLQFHEMGFFHEFWRIPAVAEKMPEPLSNVNFYAHAVFSQSSSFLLGGKLAWTLAGGGAYENHKAGSVDAKRLGDAAAAELVHDDYDNVLVYESVCPWSGFFHGVAWDYTWIVLDRPARLLHVLAATDTD